MAKIKNPLIVIKKTSGGGAAYRITTAELPATTINLLQNGTIIDTKTTDATTGGKVSFDVAQLGTYEVQAVKNGATLWTNSVTVNNIGEFIVKSGKALNDYTPDAMHTALQGAYFSTMFSLKDTFTLVKTGNILNNHKFFVEKITSVDGKEIVDFRMSSQYSGGKYNINPRFAQLKSASDTSWNVNVSCNIFGYKYSVMRQRMMKMGEAVYMQAQSIKPDDSTIADGIPFSQMKYTDNNNVSAIYTYNNETDTMTPLTSWQPTTGKTGYLVKGYFKSVGTIDENTFNNGNYYTYNTSTYVYTPATTYVSGTSYYGFYETLQEDGIFADALANSGFGSYLVRFNDKASSGGTYPYVNEFNDYADIPAVEEITGTNEKTVLMSGKKGKDLYSWNIVGEGTKKPAYDEFSIQATGDSYWTRSVTSTGYSNFIYIFDRGDISSGVSYYDFGVRLGFRLS